MAQPYYTVFKHRKVQLNDDTEFFFCSFTLSDIITIIITARYALGY